MHFASSVATSPKHGICDYAISRIAEQFERVLGNLCRVDHVTNDGHVDEWRKHLEALFIVDQKTTQEVAAYLLRAKEWRGARQYVSENMIPLAEMGPAVVRFPATAGLP